MKRNSKLENIIMNTMKQVHKIIEECKNIIIVTHTNPDGDAIGSLMALNNYFLKKGIQSLPLIDSPVPEHLKFLDAFSNIEIFDRVKHFNNFITVEAFFVLDLNDPKRLRKMENQVLNSPAAKILFDHHAEGKQFADIYITNPEAASTAELIWQFIKQDDDFKMTPDIAEALYVGLMTDTGGFRHQRTVAKSFKIAADLVNHGADPVFLYDAVYNQFSKGSITLLGMALQNVKLYYNDKLCIMAITEDMFSQTNTSNDDLEGFVERTLSIKGVKIGILISQEPGSSEIKASFRSKDNYNVRELAAAFGGGGHINASGARFKNYTLTKVKNLIVNESATYFKRN